MLRAVCDGCRILTACEILPRHYWRGWSERTRTLRQFYIFNHFRYRPTSMSHTQTLPCAGAHGWNVVDRENLTEFAHATASVNTP